MTDRIDETGPVLRFAADGAGAVFHVYDRGNLARPPRRYTVGAGQRIEGQWDWNDTGSYDLWVLGPNGFHRHFAGHRDNPPIELNWHFSPDRLELRSLASHGGLRVRAMTPAGASRQEAVLDGTRAISLRESRGWYDVTIETTGPVRWSRRLAGRIDSDGRETTSDPFTASFDTADPA